MSSMNTVALCRSMLLDTLTNGTLLSRGKRAGLIQSERTPTRNGEKASPNAWLTRICGNTLGSGIMHEKRGSRNFPSLSASILESQIDGSAALGDQFRRKTSPPTWLGRDEMRVGAMPSVRIDRKPACPHLFIPGVDLGQVLLHPHLLAPEVPQST